MKKIAIITASILGLGAAAVAANPSNRSVTPEGWQVLMASVSVPNATGKQTRRSSDGQTNRELDHVRFVSTPDPAIKACEKAYWPYYPSDCLQRAEMAGL